ncbi:MAG: hypothetical protein ACPGOY_17235 [Rhodospirillaceae bacterium]
MSGLDILLRREARLWAILGLIALGLAGFLALLLALSRTPGVMDVLPWAEQSAFRKVLVTHVVLSVVVWFLAVLGILTTLAVGLALRDGPVDLRRPIKAIPSLAGPILTAIGCALLPFPALLDLGTPLLNNYVPVVVHPLYFIALGLVAVGVLCPCLRLLDGVVRYWREDRLPQPAVFGAGVASVAYLSALACLVIAYSETPQQDNTQEYFEWVFWGGGHVLQIVNATAMITAWAILTPRAFGRTLMKSGHFAVPATLIAGAALVAPPVYGILDYPSSQHYTFFSGLYAVGLAPPITLISLALAGVLWTRWGGLDSQRPAHVGLVFSLLLCGLGGLFGFFSGYEDTRTPGHYHASIGGVTIAAMAVYLSILPTLNGTFESRMKRRALPLWLFGIGTIVHAAMLFTAGTFGISRKTAGSAQGLEGTIEHVLMGVMGLGGVIAVIGGILFIWIASRELWRSRIAALNPPSSMGHWEGTS